MKYNTTTFIEKAKTIHGDKYDYSKVEYKSIKEKVCIICPKHGEFWQTPDNHINQKSGCPKCGREYEASLQLKKRSTTEEFIAKSKAIFGDKYTYEKTNYVTAKIPVTITCPKHGDFLVNPHYHLTRFCGCKQCKIEAITKFNTSTTEEFIKKAKLIHGDRYNYSKVEYKDAHTPVCIICPEHGEFWQSPNKHLNGHNCPKCRRSRGEEMVDIILSDLKIPFSTQTTYQLENRRISFDFEINKDDQKYIIEYNGIQHYQPCDYFGGEETFKNQIERDNDLRQFCQNNNYKLLEIKYTESKDKIKELITSFLNAPTISDNSSKLGELLEVPHVEDNQQPSLELTIEEGSETNTWNCNAEYNSDTSTQHLETDEDIVRTI